LLSLVVCVKQVPDTQRATFDASTGSIDRTGTRAIMNPDDAHAVETALSIRDEYGGRITALSMGPPQAADVLRDALALGVDDCVLLSDPRLAGSDSLATSRALSRAIRRIGYDIVVTGREAIDGNTGHVGYQLSEFIGAPLLTQLHRIQIEGRHLSAERIYGHEYQKIRTPLPVILAVDAAANQVRIPRLADIAAAAEAPITVIGVNEIGGSDDEYGVAGSPTKVLKTELFTHSREGEIIEGGIHEKVERIVQILRTRNILRY